MKRVICLLLTLLLLCCLYGCDQEAEIHFFYSRIEVQYGISDGVIASEPRSIETDGRDLSYLLKLYLEGPISQELRSPFPRGTSLEALIQEDSIIVITLTEPFDELQNMDYMIACTCIASTCFGLTEADTVTIKTDVSTLTLSRESVVLEDLTATSIPK